MKYPRTLIVNYGFLLFVCIFAAPISVAADTDIGNGKLFFCRNTSIILRKTGTVISAARAGKRFRKIMNKQKKRIAALRRRSKQWTKALRAKKAAMQGLRDVRKCQTGDLDNGSGLVGGWNLISENGKTPAENGFNSLTINFTKIEFTSDYDSDALDCHWEGTYTTSDNVESATLLTTFGTGGLACEQAIGQSRTAAVTLSEDGNLLTLDYRPAGTLQVYQRVS